MIHAFMLVVFLNGAQQPAPMYFYDVDRCIYFKKRISQQKEFSAYCKPVYIKDEGQVYK